MMTPPMLTLQQFHLLTFFFYCYQPHQFFYLLGIFLHVNIWCSEFMANNNMFLVIFLSISPVNRQLPFNRVSFEQNPSKCPLASFQCQLIFLSYAVPAFVEAPRFLGCTRPSPLNCFLVTNKSNIGSSENQSPQPSLLQKRTELRGLNLLLIQVNTTKQVLTPKTTLSWRC